MESAVKNIAPSARRSTIESIESFELNLKRVLLPTQIAGWISGFGIIEYPLGYPRLIISILYLSMIYGSLLILNIYFWYPLLLRASVGQINLSSALFYIGYCMLTMLSFEIVILHWINQQKINSCLRRLAEIKREMKQLEYNENRTRAVRIQIIQILTVIILMTFIILQTIRISLRITNMTWIVTVKYVIISTLPAFFNLTNDITFMNYVTFIKWEFVELNKKMNGLFSAIEEKLSMENSNDYLEENAQYYCDWIKTTRRLHLHLVKLSRRVNNAYGVQILLSVIISTVILVVALYYVHNTVKGLINGKESTVFPISAIIWSAFWASKILAINLSCAHTMDEAREIGYVITKLNVKATNERMELETRLFTMQLLQNPLTFTAEGFFNLGYSCILLVISIVIVYLSLLIEMNKTGTDFGTTMTGMNNSVTE